MNLVAWFAESILNKLARMWQILNVVRSISKRHGGLRGVAAKLFRLWGDEGAQGILRRARLISGIRPKKNNYRAWVDSYDRQDSHDLPSMRAEWAGQERQPLISVIMVLKASDENRLAAAIGAISSQVYSNWELWVVSDVALMSGQFVLPAAAASDPRIRFEFGPADSLEQVVNLVLGKVAGEGVVFLDGGGLLSAHALHWVARALVEHGDAGFIYADEDKIDARGKRFAPHFKPDWNPDLFLSCDYTGAFKVFRTELMRAMGGLQAGYGGSRGYDAALRATERLSADGIYHIPRILYHEYCADEKCDDAKARNPQRLEFARLAVKHYLDRRAIPAMVSESPEMPGCLRVRYALPASPPLVTLVIPTRNGLALLRRCLESIEAKTDYPCYDIIVVDNGSDEPASLAYLESLKGKANVEVLRDDGPFNFSRLNNLAVGRAKGALVGLLNNDLEVIDAGWLSEMVSQALRPDIGIVGARLWYPDDTIQHAGVIMTGGVAGHVHKGLARGDRGYFGRAVLVQNFVAVTAACLVVRKDIYEEVGGLDEAFAVAFNDIDFCLRVAARGYRNLWTPYAQLYHHESASRGYEDTPEKVARFMREVERMRERWGNALFDDPAYNPNLDPEAKDFSLAWPPGALEHGAG